MKIMGTLKIMSEPSSCFRRENTLPFTIERKGRQYQLSCPDGRNGLLNVGARCQSMKLDRPVEVTMENNGHIRINDGQSLVISISRLNEQKWSGTIVFRISGYEGKDVQCTVTGVGS